MPQNRTSSSKTSDQGSDISIRAQPILSPIIVESGNTTPPPPLATEFEYLRDLVIRNTHQMKIQAQMKKPEDDRYSDREEFKSLLMDIQLKSRVGSCDRGPGSPSPRSDSVHASYGERSITHNREGPLFLLLIFRVLTRAHLHHLRQTISTRVIVDQQRTHINTNLDQSFRYSQGQIYMGGCIDWSNCLSFTTPVRTKE